MDQELAQLHQERDELERGNQNLMQELGNMNSKYVRPSLYDNLLDNFFSKSICQQLTWIALFFVSNRTSC